MNFSALSRKELLKDHHAIADSWLQLNVESSHAARVESLKNELTALIVEKHRIDEQQKTLSGAIGRAKAAGESADELIVDMRSTAKAAKSMSESVKNTADALLSCLSTNSGVESENLPETKCPGQFQLPVWQSANKSIGYDQSIESGKVEISHLGSSDEDCLNHIPGAAVLRSVKEDVASGLWDNYVNEHPEATHYHQYAWRHIVARNFKQKAWYLSVLDSAGNISGVLSLVHMNSPISGSYLLSMPWLIYGGSLASDSFASELIASHVKQQVSELGCSHAELRQVHSRPDWQLMPGKVAMVLTLPESIAELNESLGATLRSQVRRSKNHEPEIEFGGVELVGSFYQVFSEKMRDLGTPVYHRGFFEDIATVFADSTTVVVVKKDGRPVAAALLVKFRNTIEIPWAASRRKYNSTGVNMFMYHQILEYSVKAGFQFFDFGRSTVATGTYRFKQQWGAQPYALEWHRYPSDGNEGPSSNDAKASLKFRMAIAVWKKCPLWLTNKIGPSVARNLPW